MGSRAEYTEKDRHSLVEYLVTLPEDQWGALTTYRKGILRGKLQGHSEQSWHNHYKKNKEYFVARIERYRRQKQRANEATEGKGKGKEDDNSKETGNENGRSGRGATTPHDNGNNKQKKRLTSPEEVRRTAKKRKETRTKFNHDKDWPRLIKMLAKAKTNNWKSSEVYVQLANKFPSHTQQSWQSYHSKSRDEADEALESYLQQVEEYGAPESELGSEPEAESDAEPEPEPFKSKAKARQPSPPRSAPQPAPIASTSKAAIPTHADDAFDSPTSSSDSELQPFDMRKKSRAPSPRRVLSVKISPEDPARLPIRLVSTLKLKQPERANVLVDSTSPAAGSRTPQPERQRPQKRVSLQHQSLNTVPPVAPAPPPQSFHPPTQTPRTFARTQEKRKSAAQVPLPDEDQEGEHELVDQVEEQDLSCNFDYTVVNEGARSLSDDDRDVKQDDDDAEDDERLATELARMDWLDLPKQVGYETLAKLYPHYSSVEWEERYRTRMSSLMTQTALAIEALEEAGEDDEVIQDMGQEFILRELTRCELLGLEKNPIAWETLAKLYPALSQREWKEAHGQTKRSIWQKLIAERVRVAEDDKERRRKRAEAKAKQANTLEKGNKQMQRTASQDKRQNERDTIEKGQGEPHLAAGPDAMEIDNVLERDREESRNQSKSHTTDSHPGTNRNATIVRDGERHAETPFTQVAPSNQSTPRIRNVLRPASLPHSVPIRSRTEQKDRRRTIAVLRATPSPRITSARLVTSTSPRTFARSIQARTPAPVPLTPPHPVPISLRVASAAAQSPVSSGTTQIHHSQYSVLPSPFKQSSEFGHSSDDREGEEVVTDQETPVPDENKMDFDTQQPTRGSTIDSTASDQALRQRMDADLARTSRHEAQPKQEGSQNAAMPLFRSSEESEEEDDDEDDDDEQQVARSLQSQQANPTVVNETDSEDNAEEEADQRKSPLSRGDRVNDSFDPSVLAFETDHLEPIFEPLTAAEEAVGISHMKVLERFRMLEPERAQEEDEEEGTDAEATALQREAERWTRNDSETGAKTQARQADKAVEHGLGEKNVLCDSRTQALPEMKDKELEADTAATRPGDEQTKKRRRSENSAQSVEVERAPAKKPRTLIETATAAPSSASKQVETRRLLAHQGESTVQAADPPAISNVKMSRSPRQQSRASTAASSPRKAVAPSVSACMDPFKDASSTAVSRPAEIAAPTTARRTVDPDANARMYKDLQDVAETYHLSFKFIDGLYFRCCTPARWDLFRTLASFYSPDPKLRPVPSSPEYRDLEKKLSKLEWSLEEDLTLLQGSKEERIQLEKRKGKKWVKTRQEFLTSIGKDKVDKLPKAKYCTP